MRLLVLLLMILVGCDSGMGRGPVRIGVDPNWAPLNFGAQQPYVNGFTEALLLDVAGYSGVSFEKVRANWDTLLEGMQRGQYEAILSSMPPYPFYEAKYDFSEVFLPLGPVLIVAASSSMTAFEELQFVGIIEGDPAERLLDPYPAIIVRRYPSLPELFNGIVQGEIDGVLHNRLPAVNYVQDLYAGQLKIASPPLTDAGLRLIVPKGKAEFLLHQFDRSLKHFRKKSRLEQLEKKWQLT